LGPKYGRKYKISCKDDKMVAIHLLNLSKVHSVAFVEYIQCLGAIGDGDHGYLGTMIKQTIDGDRAHLEV
jgi:hypothetical protein